MKSNKYLWQSIAGFNGLVALVMGTLAAHAIADSHAAAMAEKASFYQLIHAVLLFVLVQHQGKLYSAARGLLMSGIIFFCGSLYIKSLTGWSAITGIAPLGGLSFMAAWICVAFAQPKRDL